MVLLRETIDALVAGGDWAPHGSGVHMSVMNLPDGRSQLLYLSDTQHGALLLSPIADAGDTKALALLRTFEAGDDYSIETASSVFISITQTILYETSVDEFRSKAAMLATYADSVEKWLDPREDKW
jgi:hypothetical protein